MTCLNDKQNHKLTHTYALWFPFIPQLTSSLSFLFSVDNNGPSFANEHGVKDDQEEDITGLYTDYSYILWAHAES